MPSGKRRSALLLVLTALSLMVCGCSLFETSSEREPAGSTAEEGSSPAIGAASQPAAEPQEVDTVALTVRIEGFEFKPAVATVKVGETVAWLNQDPVAHTVTGGGWDSGTLGPGFEFRHKFTSPGEYEYRSMLSPMTRGRVTVR